MEPNPHLSQARPAGGPAPARAPEGVWGRRVGATLLAAAAAVLLLAAPVAAAGGAFADLADYAWAVPGVVALQGQGAIDGVGPGTFDPGGLLTRAETAAVLGRLLGWPAAAGSSAPPFTDAAAIPAYARPYVALAAARGILQGLPGGAFAPQGNLTWPQLAAITARALAEPPVPADRLAALLSQLPLGPSTPQWAQQGVAQDVQAGDFAGVLADLFAPPQPVSRAELAAFLAQAQQGAGGGGGLAGTVLSGRLTAWNGSQASVQAAAGTRQMAVAPGAAVYDGPSPGGLGDLQVGDSVTLAGAGGAADAVGITAGPSVTQPVGPTAGLSGTLAWSAASDVGLDLPGMATLDVPLAADVAVTQAGGQPAAVGDLAAGQRIRVTLNDAGQAVAIVAAGNAPTASMGGSVVSLTGSALVVDISGVDETFSLPAGLAGTAGLAQGAQVTLTLALPSGQVTGLTVDAPAPQTSVTGTIASLAGDTLVLDGPGGSQTYTLSAATTVDGVPDDPAALAAGQTVTLLASGGLVSSVEIAPASTTVSGVIASVLGDALVVDVAGADQSYTLTASTLVNGQPGDLAALAAGQAVTLLASGGQVGSVEIAGGTTTTVTGVVASAIGDLLEVDVAGTDQSYTLTASTTVNGVPDDLGAIVAGQTVTLTVSGGQVAAVQTGATATTVTGVVASIAGDLLEVDVAGTDQDYTLTASTTVNGVPDDLGAIAAGQTVALTLSGGTVTAVETAAGATVSGVIASVSGGALVLDVAGTDQTYALSPSATVNGVPDDLAALGPGQTATLTLSGGQVATIVTGAAATVTGQVASVAGDTLVVDVAGIDQAYALTASTTVDGLAGNLGALAPGDTVTLSLDGTQVAAAELGTATSATSATGVVESLAGNNLILNVADAAEIFTVTPATTVNGVYGDLSALVPGTTVSLTLSSGTVTAIEVVPTGGTSVTGQVLSLAGDTLDLEVSGSGQVYTVTSTTTVDGRLNDLGAVFIGETVTATVSGSAVTAIVTSAAGAATGTVVSASASTLVVDVSGTDQTYTLTASTTVDGALDNAGALAAGQSVTVYGSGGQATAVQITSASGGAGVVGLVSSVSGDTLVVDVAGVNAAYTMGPATTVDGALNDLGAVASGQTVSVSATSGQVTAVRILSAGGSYSATGVVASVSGYVLVLDAGGTDETFTLTAATAVNGVPNDTGAIAAGDTVTLTLAAGQVTTLQIG